MSKFTDFDWEKIQKWRQDGMPEAKIPNVEPQWTVGDSPVRDKLPEAVNQVRASFTALYNMEAIPISDQAWQQLAHDMEVLFAHVIGVNEYTKKLVQAVLSANWTEADRLARIDFLSVKNGGKGGDTIDHV